MVLKFLFIYVLVGCLWSGFYCLVEPRCLGSKNHKPEPSKEDFLHGECSKWSELSCCTRETSETFHIFDSKEGFDFDHCGQMSESCRKYFIKESCLYECDPFLVPWIVKDNSSTRRSERIYQVPLCKRDCDNWFNACKEDFTCRDNWYKGFEWIQKRNFCPNGEKCMKFKEKFKTAENFCSKIWDESFKVSSDDSAKCVSFDSNDIEEKKKSPAITQTCSTRLTLTVFQSLTFLF